jgi:hypothetical protein
MLDQDIDKSAEKDSEDDQRADPVLLFLPLVGMWCFTHRIPNAVVVLVHLRFHDLHRFLFSACTALCQMLFQRNHRRFFQRKSLLLNFLN